MIHYIGLIALGLIAGFTSGLLGIGGGVILVPALALIFGIPFHKAIGISLAIIIPTALSSMLKHYSEGNVDFSFALVITIFAVIGGWLGASYSTALPAATLKKVFAVFMIIIGCNMLFGWSNKAVQTVQVTEKNIQKNI